MAYMSYPDPYAGATRDDRRYLEQSLQQPYRSLHDATSSVEALRQPYETFTERQQRLGSTPNTANRTLFPQSANVPQQSQQQQPSPYLSGYSADPNQALAALQSQFGSRFGGRQMSPQERAALMSYARYTGGNPTQEQYARASYAISQYSGDPNRPGVGTFPGLSPATPSQGPGTQAGPRLPYAQGYQGTPGFGVQPGQGYTPDLANLPRFQAPNQAPTDDRMMQILNQVLANPETMSEDVKNKLKSRSKESALAQAEQLRSGVRSDLARRGFAGGGTEAAADTALNLGLINQLISQNRDIDIQAAQQNRADTAGALGLGGQVLGGQLGRAVQAYQPQLQAFGLGEQLAQGASSDDLQRRQFEFGQQQADRAQRLAEFLGEAGVGLDERKFQELQQQFKATTGLDLMRFLEQQRQFNLGFGEGQRQFDVGTGLDYGRLQLQGQQTLNQFLQSLYGV